MDYYPLFANLHGAPCLIVGGGEVATRKARELVAAGAIVTVNAPRCAPAMLELLRARPDMRLHPADFDPGLIGNQLLVIAATSDPLVNREVAAAARTANTFCNVVDDPVHSGFIVPAVIDRSPVMVAFTTGGESPLLARLLRQRIEQWLPPRLGQLARWAARWRKTVRSRLQQTDARRRFLERLLTGAAGTAVLQDDEARADSIAGDLLDAASRGSVQGHAWLVGAGPGDPGLISVHGRRALEQADVVMHDRLIAPELLAGARREAQIIDVGKAAGAPSKTQKEINELLILHVRAGRLVCRLKSGDPFIFGRGGEEIETLAEHGVPFEVVPGVTAASGCGSYAGIPLTHRDHAQICVFATGHLKDGSVNLDWKALSRPHQTVVFYMGIGGAGEICNQLMDNGLPEDYPAAVVQHGTSRRQRVLTATLATLASEIDRLDIRPPALIIIGTVVTLQSKLAWFKP